MPDDTADQPPRAPRVRRGTVRNGSSPRREVSPAKPGASQGSTGSAGAAAVVPDVQGAPASAPTSAVGAPPAKRRVHPAIIGLIATIGTAVAGATAAAIITPARIEALFGGGATPVATAPPIEFKTATDASDSISFSIPENWAVGLARYEAGIDEVVDEGAGVLTGTTTLRSVTYGESTAYLGASVETPARLGLVGAAEDELRGWMRQTIAAVDWTIEECVLASENEYAIEGWLSESRLWKDCASLEGTRLLEWFALTADGSVMQVGQVLLEPEVPDSVLQEIVSSVVIRAENLPRPDDGHGVVP